jgi:hypothetical protein
MSADVRGWLLITSAGMVHWYAILSGIGCTSLLPSNALRILDLMPGFVDDQVCVLNDH